VSTARALPLVVAFALAASGGCRTQVDRGTPDSRYRKVSLSEIVQSPQRFHNALIRVDGWLRLGTEANTLWVDQDSLRAWRPPQGVWIDVEGPRAVPVDKLNGTRVTIEGRFDAEDHGYLHGFGGEITDIRAIWQLGNDAPVVVMNYETSVHALERLRFRTGWIAVGTFRTPIFGGPKGWGQTWFEPIGAQGAAVRRSLPNPGDVIRLTVRSRIDIPGYATAGEEHRLESPMANERHRTSADDTEFSLPPGAIVRVADVQVAWLGDMGIVWVRAVPLGDLW
jgi:hypothetical protein